MDAFAQLKTVLGLDGSGSRKANGSASDGRKKGRGADASALLSNNVTPGKKVKTLADFGFTPTNQK